MERTFEDRAVCAVEMHLAMQTSEFKGESSRGGSKKKKMTEDKITDSVPKKKTSYK